MGDGNRGGRVGFSNIAAYLAPYLLRREPWDLSIKILSLSSPATLCSRIMATGDIFNELLGVSIIFDLIPPVVHYLHGQGCVTTPGDIVVGCRYCYLRQINVWATSMWVISSWWCLHPLPCCGFCHLAIMFVCATTTGATCSKEEVVETPTLEHQLHIAEMGSW